MGWIAPVILGVGGAIGIFILATDGRYFGKPLMRWVYNVFGPTIFGSHSEEGLWQALVDALHLDGDEHILDVGTAVGDLPLTFAAQPDFRGHVTGIDWSPRMIAAARESATRDGLTQRASFDVVDIRDGLPFENATFDVVICLGLVETLRHPAQILAELNRVLKSGGKLVLSHYQGLASTSAALSIPWYRRQLSALGFANFRRVHSRRSQDVLIAHSKST